MALGEDIPISGSRCCHRLPLLANNHAPPGERRPRLLSVHLRWPVPHPLSALIATVSFPSPLQDKVQAPQPAKRKPGDLVPAARHPCPTTSTATPCRPSWPAHGWEGPGQEVWNTSLEKGTGAEAVACARAPRQAAAMQGQCGREEGMGTARLGHCLPWHHTTV